ncbi:hypothetical protein COS53_04175 [Candidatus Shapirobacteria bacterium CG03_land_8_20_14_0_80_35_14]|uniref:Uncharacterized protein n=1 Tax=Candidatus Shapirobacteria bacterium CG03_land_8_20_14_0_80_35_14 TaxID=1974878 RepID=A0A2M7BM64_9BACT|nr:MAG: hypothetical protein COS53_04175 [Candidatus Shapirobacteria bacterium CG03_land_8_20_14_0_80_35_14]
MDLQQIKEILNKAGFSAESLTVMNQVLDEAIEKSFLTKEGKEKLLGIIDTETELANIEADTMEQVAIALESFASELDKANEIAGNEVDTAEKTFDFDDKQIQDTLAA